MGVGGGAGGWRGVDGEETSDYSEVGASAEGDAGAGGGAATGAGGAGGGGYGARRRGRRRREQLRSYRSSYRPKGANDASPPRIPYRSVSPSPAAGVERRGQKTDKEKEKEMETEKAKDQSNNKKKKTELGKGLRGNLDSLSTPDTHTRASSPDPDRGGGERKSRSRQPRKLAEAISAALEEVVASALEEVRTRNRAGSPTVSSRMSKVVPSATTLPVPPIPPPVVPYAVEKEDVVLDYTQVLDICLPPPLLPASTTFSSSVGIPLFILFLHLVERKRNIPYHIDIYGKLVHLGLGF